MQAQWQNNHEEIMEQEAKKTKLKIEVEVLETQRKELVEALTDLRKCIMADKGDYGTTEAERIFKIEDLDNEVVKLTVQVQEKQGTLKGVTNTHNSLTISSKALENQIEKLSKKKTDIEEELQKTSDSLDKVKIIRQEEEEKRRVKVAELIMEIDELSKKLGVLNQEYETKRIHILTEERRISIRRSDLEIYEARLKRKFPNENFVLKENAITSEN